MRNERIIYRESYDNPENSIDLYIGKSGIWALFGKEQQTSEYRCLNVGKCVNVGSEILYDLACFHHIPFRKNGNLHYINQFGEDCGFCYVSGQTQEYLYPYIKQQNYSEIVFVYISQQTMADKERDFAWRTHAKYWRNGGSFKKEKDQYYGKNWRNILSDDKKWSKVTDIDEIIDLIQKDRGYE